MHVFGSKNETKGKKKKEKIMLKKLFSFLFFVNYKRIIHYEELKIILQNIQNFF